jgi:hypothetical protein
MVNAEKEGQIESKLMKARQMEEIREAKRKEAEARQEQKKSKLVCSVKAAANSGSPVMDYANKSIGRDKGLSTSEEEAQERRRHRIQRGERRN